MLGGYPKAARLRGSIDGYPMRRSPLGQLSGMPDISRRLDIVHPINRGLCGWWPMDEGQGPRARDLSTYLNHGTLTNMADPPTSISGWGGGVSQRELAFDQVNDYVLVPHGAHLAILTDITVSWWVKMRSNPTGYPAIQKGGNYPNPYGLSSQSDRKWNFTRGNGASQTYVLGNTPAAIGVWTLVIGTWSNSLYSVYINGVLDNTAAGAGTVTDSGNGLGIGTHFPFGAGNQYMVGEAAHARIWNRAITATETKQLYADKWIGSIGGIT